MKLFLSLLAFVVVTATFAVRPASADDVIVIDRHAPPQFQTWQSNWDRFEYDRRHVILGTVAKFEPFRLEIARRDGAIQMIDLKNGTVILPTGATPMLNERVAIVGYYSHGTFIANRVIIRT